MLRAITEEQYGHSDFDSLPPALTYEQIEKVLDEFLYPEPGMYGVMLNAQINEIKQALKEKMGVE